MLKYLLLPLSFLYGLILKVRHFLFDAELIKSKGFDFPIIVIGNISLGGTGKSPHTLYISDVLKIFNPAVLSRGYGRKTTGFRKVEDSSNTSDCGDEPLMFKYLNPSLDVYVCENRVEGIENILSKNSNCGVIILDDAFQHRKLKPGLSILLYDYSSLQSKDCLLPAGRRRDLNSRYRYADLIIISKSPITPDKGLTNLFRNKRVFFSRYEYQNLRNIRGKTLNMEELDGKSVYLLTGIANPEPMISYFGQKATEFTHSQFPDHHDFSVTELEKVKENMVKFAAKDGICITTTKDLMRLKNKLEPHLLEKWYCPEPVVVFEDPDNFNKAILDYVRANKSNH
ncbi:MAG: tetraacyldisaccharide 4'-kinase [Bacteroidetes bacterium]|nr:tetraacyldisaccharide 4'-kinase [Bacteroidota bacterium]